MRRSRSSSQRSSSVKLTVRSSEERMVAHFVSLCQLDEEEAQKLSQGDVEKALQKRKATFVSDSQGQPFPLNVDLSEFMKYGPGTYLLFRFLKGVSLVMLVLAVLACIQIAVLASEHTEGASLWGASTLSSGLIKISIAMSSQSRLIAVQVFASLSLLIKLVAILIWIEFQEMEIIKITEVAPLASYQTIMMTKIPEGFSEAQILEYLKKCYGQIKSIYTVKNYGKDLALYRELTNIVEAYKRQRALNKILPEIHTSSLLIDNFFRFRDVYLKANHDTKVHEKYEFFLVFITFEKAITREAALFDQRPSFLHDQNQIQEVELFKGQKLNLQACQMEPDGIIWENISIKKTERLLRAFLEFIVILLVFLVSASIIILLSATQLAFSYHTAVITKQQAIASPDQSLKTSYCLSLSFLEVNNETELCSNFVLLYVQTVLLSTSIPLLLGLFKSLLTRLMLSLVEIRKHCYQVTKTESQMVLLHLFYFFATGILPLIIAIRFGSSQDAFSFTGLMAPSVRGFMNYNAESKQALLPNDFNTIWYELSVSRVFLVAFLSFPSTIVSHVLFSWIQSKIVLYLVGKEILQKDMDDLVEGESLCPEFVYGISLTFLYFQFLYGGCMPIVTVCCAISLLSFYLSNKLIFIRFCRTPPVFNHSVNRLASKWIMAGLVMQAAMSSILIGAKRDPNSTIIQRLFERPLWIAIALFVMVYSLFRENIILLARKLIKCIRRSLGRPPRQQNMSLNKLACVKPVAGPCSYSMHDNPRYKKILRTLYTLNKLERRRGTILQNKQMYELENSEASNEPAELILEMMKLATRDSRHYAKRHQESFNRSANPYDHSKKRLSNLLAAVGTEEEASSPQPLRQRRAFRNLLELDCIEGTTHDFIQQTQ